MRSLFNEGKKALLAVMPLFVLFLLNPFTVLADTSLKVEGASFITEVTPGNTYTHTMVVSLEGDSPPLEMKVDINGFGQTLDGSYEPLAAENDSNPNSGRTFITHIDKATFHLEPGASEVVTATITVPDDIGPGSKYAIIHIHSQPGGSGGVGVILAANVPVVLSTQGFIKEGNITDLSIVKAVRGEPIEISTIFQNKGNHHFKVFNELAISDKNGRALASYTSPLTFSSVIPPYAYQFESSLVLPQAIATGTYTVASSVISEDGTIMDTQTTTFQLENESTMTRINWSMFGILMACILVIGFLILVLIRRKQSGYY